MSKNKYSQISWKASFGIITSLLMSSTFAASVDCEQQNNDTADKVQKCMTIDGLVDHLKTFQHIADNNPELPGTRFTNTEGFNASRDYIVKKLTDAGYRVSLQDVPMEISYIKAPRVFEQTLPLNKHYIDDVDYAPLVNSGGGDVTATVQLPSGKESGCNPSDFSGFTPGNIALIQWGDKCSLESGVVNAVKAGAKAVILYSTHYDVVYVGIESSIPSETTPVLLTSHAVANALKDSIASGIAPTVHIQFNMIKTTTASQNIIAESRGGNPDHVVMVGAHFDSSAGNPGMNDNSSAAATVLETALVMQKSDPVNKLRFAFWTGEELGLRGSNYYMEQLSPDEKKKIALYLNYEILGAPNGGRLIMGAKNGVTPPGTEKISKFYANYFKSQGLKSYVFDPQIGDAARRSDMLAFMNAGIPVGYLVTGAELAWNPLLSAIFTDLPNRVVGMATHPCYHKHCDKLTWVEGPLQDPNFDFDLYLQMSKAAAYTIASYSMNLNNAV